MSTPLPGPGPGPGAPPPYSPPPIYAPLAPPPPPKRRRFHPLLIVGVGFVLLLCVCSTISLLGNVGKTLYATATAQAAASGSTGAAPAATAIVAQGAPQNTPAPVAPTDTAVPAVPPTPAPPTATPVPVLGFADTATFPDWVMSLGKLETHAQLAGATAQGRYWVVALDARNTGAAAHPLTDGFTFMLRDSTGQETPALVGVVVDSATKAAGREALSKAAAPKGLVHPLLVFDLPAATLPQQLVIRRADPAGEVRYDLVATAQAQATAEVQAQATQAAVAQAQATGTAVAAEAARSKAAQATTTAEAKRIASLVNTPAKGTFRGSNSDFQVALGVERYVQSLGYETASARSHYVVLGVAVYNESNRTQAINPNDFTLTLTDGSTYAYDSATFTYENPFPSVNVPAGANGGGALVFLTSKQAAPHYLIFQPFLADEIRIDLTAIGDPDK